MADKVGEKHVTNEGYIIEIIKYVPQKNYTIQFNDGNIIKNRQYIDIVKGRIKNPYHKSVFGVGYLGAGIYSKIRCVKIYQTWQCMLQRCYDLKFQESKPTYIGIVVTEDWKNFQNFGKWFEENYVEDFQLDKDILIKGNKIYSPETCCFVPKEINLIFTKNNAKRGDYPIGVYKRGNGFEATVCTSSKSLYLGSFTTPKEAFQAYKTAKENYIKEVAEKWKDKITEQTYRALINYQVEITD